MSLLSCNKWHDDQYVIIHDKEFRDKYMEVISKTDLKYEARSDGVIHIYNASYEELKNKMNEYYKWERKVLEERGVQYLE
jgi:Tat protein secretion system quality control protein TatD with DNase activity